MFPSQGGSGSAVPTDIVWNWVWFSREPREEVNVFVSLFKSKWIIDKEKKPKYIIRDELNFTNSFHANHNYATTKPVGKLVNDRTGGLFLESPENFSGRKSHFINCDPLTLEKKLVFYYDFEFRKGKFVSKFYA